MLTLRFFGAPSVRDAAGNAIPAIERSPKMLALLAYVVTAGSEGVRRRDSVAALLWPERDDRRARHALRQLLTRFRSVAGPACLDCDHDEALRLDRRHAGSDVDVFERGLAEGRPVEALAAYTGPFLEGLHVPGAPDFEAWMDGTRSRYRKAAIDAADRLAEAAREAGDVVKERFWLERGTGLDPYSERRSSRLVELLVELGERGAAVLERERLVQRLSEDLGLKPEPVPAASNRQGGPPRPRSRPLTADEEVQRGQHHLGRWSSEALERALIHFSRAARIDPDSPTPHGGLALAYCMVGHFGQLPPELAFPRAEAAALRALELEHAVAEAHLSLGLKLHLYDRDVKRALEHLGQARDAAPHHPLPHWALGLVLGSLEQHDRACDSMRRAHLLQPISLPATTGLAWLHIGAGDFEQAERPIWDTLELDPDSPTAHFQLGIVHLLRDNPRTAAHRFQHALERSPGNPMLLSALGYALGIDGNDDASHAVLRRLRSGRKAGHYVPPLAFAAVHAGRNELEPALDWLEKALQERDAFAAFLRTWPFTRRLHRLPRFGPLRDRLFVAPPPA